MITITKRAKEQLQKTLENHNGIIKIGVKSGGCSGFTYDISLVDFDDVNNDDKKIDENIYLDGVSELMLFGTELDFQDTIMGSHYVFNNPNEKSSCGCNASFSI